MIAHRLRQDSLVKEIKVRQQWFNPGNGRHYVVEVYEDLLGDVVLLRRWSGAYRPGSQKMSLPGNLDVAVKQAQAIEGKRQARGYRRVL